MIKLLKILDMLMSDIAVACYAAVIAVVVFVFENELVLYL